MDENTKNHPVIQAAIVAVVAGSVVFGVVNYYFTQEMKILNRNIEDLQNNSMSTNTVNGSQSSQDQANSSSAETADQRRNVKVATWHKFSTGEYDSGTRIRPRHYCNHDVNVEA